MSAPAKHVGECKWFNSKKGFGFITPKDGSEEVFVHQSEIRADGFRSLGEKEIVEYELAMDEVNRPKAVNVTGPSGAAVKGAPKPRPRYYAGRKGDAAANADGSKPAEAGAAAPASAQSAAAGSAAPAAGGARPARKAREPKAAAAAAAPAAAPAAK